MNNKSKSMPAKSLSNYQVTPPDEGVPPTAEDELGSSTEESNEMDEPSEDNEDTESPVKQYWESLDSTERDELCSLVKEYESSKTKKPKSGEVDVEDMMPENE